MSYDIGDAIKELKIILHQMDEKVDRLDTKADRLDVSVAKIEVTLDHNTQSLQEHVRRTNLLQTQVQQVDERVKYWEIALRVVGGLLALAGTIAGIWGVTK